MKKQYMVEWVIDNKYAVIEITARKGDNWDPATVDEEKVFQGSLTDCDAFIRLKEGGYM